MRQQPKCEHGFTLIEIMVALTITLLALNVVFGGILSTLRATTTAAKVRRAIAQAEYHLAALPDPGQALAGGQGKTMTDIVGKPSSPSWAPHRRRGEVAPGPMVLASTGSR